MIKAALFDLDGVVFDTEPQYTLFWGEIGRKYLPHIPDLSNKIKGQTLAQIYGAYFSDLQAEQVQITALLNDFERSMKFEYIPGFQDFVAHLRQKGIKTGIVTSSNQDKMQSLYKFHPEVQDVFDKIFTAECVMHSKPHPECYLKGAEAFGLLPEECVGFEDSFNGLKAVRAAGMFVVGLATTNSEQSIAPYCDVVINDYTNWTHRIPLFI